MRTRGSCGTSMVGCSDARAKRNASGRPLPHSAGAVASSPPQAQAQAQAESDGVVMTTMFLSSHSGCGRPLGDPAAALLGDRDRSVPRGTSGAFTVGRHRGRFVVWGRGTVPVWISVSVRGPRPAVVIRPFPIASPALLLVSRSADRSVCPPVPAFSRSLTFSVPARAPGHMPSPFFPPFGAADQSSARGTAPCASQKSRQHRQRHGRSQMRVRTSPQLSTGVSTTRPGP